MFREGAKSTLCSCRDTPDDDLRFGNVAKQKYSRLTEKQREWLRSLGRAPRWLVMSSGSCPPSFVQDPQKIPANVANKPEHASDKLESFTPHAEEYCEKLIAGGSQRPPSKPPDRESPPEKPPARSEVHPTKGKERREYKAREVDEARPRQIISRPYGLPKHITIEQYYSNPI